MASRSVLYYLSLLFITSWFLTIAYKCNFSNKVIADDFADNYTKFHTWSEPLLKKKGFNYLPKPTAI